MSKSRLPKILIATGIFPPDIGGPATYSHLLLNELPKRGFEVGVLSFSSVRHLPKIVRHVVYALRLWRRGREYDCIYAQDPISVGLPSLVISRLIGKKFFIRVAGDYAWEQSAQRFKVGDTIDNFQIKKYGFRVELLRWLQTMVVRRADQVITPSKYFCRLVSGWGVASGKIVAIYNGIRLEDYTGPVAAWPERPNIIISAGRLVPWKGFDGLIDLLADLPDWQLVILGDGPDRWRLGERAQTCGVANRVLFAGAVSRSQMFDWLHRAKVFVLNTAFESFSFQVVEAMHSGIPVITTKIGSLPELVTDWQEGILVQPDDLAAIKEAIIWLENHPEQRESLISQAKVKSREFTIEQTLNRLQVVIADGVKS